MKIIISPAKKMVEEAVASVGPIDILVIKPEETIWVKKKNLHGE